MEKAPFFSVILPTYNRAELLTHAVQSVIDQTFEDWELIIVDDGSTDNTRELLDTLDDSRVRYIKQENQGKGGARNTGLKFTRGQYVCFLDSDDIFYKDHLNVLKDGIHENATFKMYRTGICWNVKSGIKCQKLLNLQSKKEQISYLWNNYFSLINLCINADLAKFEVFEAYPLWQDKQYIQKLLLKEEYIQLATCTVQIYEGPERSVNRAFENWDIAKDNWIVLRRVILIYWNEMR